MSNLSTQVFGDMNHLYENIANRDSQQLNENSDYYDEEFAELVEDIFYNISYSMASEGYSANGILDFLSKAPEQDILEKYYECTISEGLVSEEYILEQLEIIDEGIGSLFKVLGKGIGMGAKALAKGTGTALKGTGRTISVATQRAIGPGGRKAIKGAVTKVKDIAKGAKTALTGSTAKKVGLGAAALGAATGAGYIGGRMSGSGDQSLSAKPNPAPKQQTPPPAPKLPAPAGNGGGGSSSSSTKSKVSTKPKESDKGPAGETPMQKWARLHKGLASKVKSGQSGYDEISQTRVKPGPNEKKDQTPTAGPEASDAQKSQAGAEVAAIQAKQKAEFEKKQKEAASTQKESYTPYDLVLEYLLTTGHASTIVEAEYVMSELDSETIDSIVESYQ